MEGMDGWMYCEEVKAKVAAVDYVRLSSLQAIYLSPLPSHSSIDFVIDYWSLIHRKSLSVVVVVVVHRLSFSLRIGPPSLPVRSASRDALVAGTIDHQPPTASSLFTLPTNSPEKDITPPTPFLPPRSINSYHQNCFSALVGTLLRNCTEVKSTSLHSAPHAALLDRSVAPSILSTLTGLHSHPFASQDVVFVWQKEDGQCPTSLQCPISLARNRLVHSDCQRRQVQGPSSRRRTNPDPSEQCPQLDQLHRRSTYPKSRIWARPRPRAKPRAWPGPARRARA